MYSTAQLSLLACQLADLRGHYPGLQVEQCRPGLSVVGDVSFSMVHKGRTVEDTFDVELRIPLDFPKTPPNAYEIGGRLSGYDHLFTDGRLCLGAPVEVCMRFAERPTLLSFVKELVVPFLFAFSYKTKYGAMPFGELAHGVEGLFEYYVDYFGASKEGTISLLIYLAYGHRHHGEVCPCGSGRKLDKCHGQRLGIIRKYLTVKTLRWELTELTTANRTVGERRRKLLSRRLRRKLENTLNKTPSN